jgi:hypothetical protein
VDTPPTADVRDRDGSDDEMFPLRTAAQVAPMLGYKTPDTIHAMWDSGQLPYVLLPSAKGRSRPESEGHRRRIRADHLRQAVLGWTNS